jgi:CRISPR/Cas system Type II protein with McrA/HNH and RuvC-like nuclease domain
MKKCEVVSVLWIDPYTGAVFSDDKKLDIDHIVPLKWAHDHEASDWDESVKRAFANDEDNLIAVDARANRSKSARGPDEWLPPDERFHCVYLAKFLFVTKKYELQLTAYKQVFIDRKLNSCEPL